MYMKDLKETTRRLFTYFKTDILQNRMEANMPVVGIGVEATFVIVGVCIFFSFAIGSVVSVILSEQARPLTDDLVFPFYDYVLRAYIPGLWFPYKEQFCKDFEDVEGIGDSFMC